MKKQTFVYPGSDLDRGRTLVALLGSFWARTYTGVDQVHSYVGATAQIVNQTYRNLLALLAGLSRRDVPLLHEETISPLVLRRSELNSFRVAADRFDLNNEQFDGDTLFNVPGQTGTFAFPIPEQLRDVAQVLNRITFPTAALQRGTDFFIDADRAAIVFAENPFDNPAFLRRAINSGDATDEELTLWCFNSKFDYEYVYTQFAYAIGVKLKTSQGYKDLMNAIFDALVSGGASVAALDAALAAICGIPVTIEKEERVEVISYDRQGLLIVTDKHVYRFPENAVPRVTLEQVVKAGTQLIRGVDISEFFVGNTYTNLISPANQNDGLICRPPADTILASTEWEGITTEGEEDILLNPNAPQCQKIRPELPALALDSGFLSACFYGDLVFENKQVPLEINVNHPSGFTFVSFEIGGYPADVERFFNDVHIRGVQDATSTRPPCPPRKRRGGTLAHFLDKRVQPAGEPTAAHLPSTINPLQFLVENVLRNNIFVVRIVVSALGQNQIGLYNIRQLRQLLPPQTAMIVVFEMGAQADAVAGDNAVRSTDLFTFVGMEPQIDTIIPCTNDIEDFSVPCVRDFGATARLVSGTCQ